MLHSSEHRPSDDLAAQSLNELMAGAPARASHPNGPKEAIDHMAATGAIQEITREAYFQIRSALPPPKVEYMHCFATGQRREPLSLYWMRDGRYFARRLTWPETFRLYDAEGLPDDLGAP
jgi:hypothetical protein